MHPAPDAHWTLRCTHHGVVAERDAEPPVRLPGSATAPEADPIPTEPALPLLLSDGHLQELRSETLRGVPLQATADTAFGPMTQDNKSRNEDFALAGCARTSSGEPWAIAAIADGVSAKTFWGGRASRIAGLTAWVTVRAWIEQHAGAPRPADDALDALRTDVVRVIVAFYRRDQENLRRAGAIPGKWSRDRYHRHQHRDPLWYNTTLHLAALGPSWGLLLSCGDGGIQITRRDWDGQTTTQVLLRAHGANPLTDYLSLNPDTARVETSWLSPTTAGPSGPASVTIALATDGVERTWRRIRDEDVQSPYRPLDPDVGPHAASLRLASLLRRPTVEDDNHSLALIQRNALHSPVQPDPAPTTPEPIKPDRPLTQDPPDWLSEIPAQFRHFFELLDAHGRIEHAYVESMLNSRSAARRFSCYLDQIPSSCPFVVWVETREGGKVYRTTRRG